MRRVWKAQKVRDLSGINEIGAGEPQGLGEKAESQKSRDIVD